MAIADAEVRQLAVAARRLARQVKEQSLNSSARGRAGMAWKAQTHDRRKGGLSRTV